MGKTLVVDCLTDKLIRIFPQMSEFVVLANTWGNLKDFNDSTLKVVYDFTLADISSINLFEFYTIKTHYSDDNIKDFLLKGIPVFLRPDAFYLPYSEYYQKTHSKPSHLILVDELTEDNLYHVYDDIPKFDGYFEEKVINEIYFSNDAPLQWFEITDKQLKHCLKDELVYLQGSFKTTIISNGTFIEKLINSDIKKMDKLSVITGLRNFIGRYNGLYRIIELLNEKFPNEELAPHCETVNNYINNWLLINNLANKGLLCNKESFWDKIQLKFEKLLEDEEKVNVNINLLSGLILPEIISKLDQE